MANESVERAVDALIAQGRVQRELRNEYIQHFEQNLKDDLLRGSDYTNKTKAVAEERRQAEAWLNQERQKFQNERRQLEQWQNSVRGELEEANRVNQHLPALTARLAAAEQALKDYQIHDKVDWSVNPAPAIPSITDRNPPPRQTQTQPTADTNHYLTREAGVGALKDLTILMGKMNKIQAQHVRLFGEPLDDDLISHYMDTGEDPERHWAIKYNVEGKKAEIARENMEAERAKMKEEIRAELLSTMALDPSRVVGSPSQNVGGLTPLFETYSKSRALAHGQNMGQDPARNPNEYVVPEMKPELAASRDRVARASEMFVKNFDALGKPISDKGRELATRYSE